MSSKKCLLLNYSLVSIFIFLGRGGKKKEGKKRAVTKSMHGWTGPFSRLKLVTITLVSFPRSSHLQPMCKTPYTTWATLIRQWQQHHTPVKQWHKQPTKKSPSHAHKYTHTDLMEREGDGGELKGTMEHKEDWDRRKKGKSQIPSSWQACSFHSSRNTCLFQAVPWERETEDENYECDAFQLSSCSTPKLLHSSKKEHSRET